MNELLIAYDGAGLSGKTTSLQAIAARLGVTLVCEDRVGMLRLELLAPRLRLVVRAAAGNAYYYPPREQLRIARPIVVQVNKRELPTARPTTELVRLLGIAELPVFESTAARGEGVWIPFEMAVLLGAERGGFLAVARELLESVTTNS
jgi:hypothetical protein